MRRISLALALLGAVAAAGCGGAGSGNPSSNTGNRGIETSKFKVDVRGEKAVMVTGTWDKNHVVFSPTLNAATGAATPATGTFDPATMGTIIVPGGGLVTGTGITCGQSGTSVYGLCAAQILYNEVDDYVLVATTSGLVDPISLRPYMVWGWAGACTGTDGCKFKVIDNRMVAIRFATTTAALGAHGPFTSPEIHGAEYLKFYQGQAGAYDCTACHGGTALTGSGIAPSCALCHGWPLPPHMAVTNSSHNSGACARCHVGSGFRDYIGADGTADNHLAGYTGSGTALQNAGALNNTTFGKDMQCDMCHNPATFLGGGTLNTIQFAQYTGAGKTVTVDTTTGICGQCHTGVRDGRNVATLSAKLASAPTDPDALLTTGNGAVRPHYLSAASTFLGSDAAVYAQISGAIYTGRNGHGGLTACTTCHSPHTGHIVEDIGAKCGGCHFDELTGQPVTTFAQLEESRQFGFEGDIDGNGTPQSLRLEVEGLKAKCLNALKVYSDKVAGTKMCMAFDSSGLADQPYVDADGVTTCGVAPNNVAYNKFTTRSVRAAFNFSAIQNDPGAWAHNPRYAIEILYDAIADLNAGIVAKILTNPPVVANGKRAFNSHFGAAEDPSPYAAMIYHGAANAVTGEVLPPMGFTSDACLQCHGGKGGYDTYLLAMPAAMPAGSVANKVNAMQCNTCHTYNGTDMRGIRSVDNIFFPPQKAGAADSGQVSFTSSTVPPGFTLCGTCHSGRENGASITKKIGATADTSWSLSFTNPHYLGAAGMMLGTSGGVMYQYAGKSYTDKPVFWSATQNGPHGSPHGGKCASCHAAKFGKHTFEINLSTTVPTGTWAGAFPVGGVQPGAVNTAACTGCHAGPYALEPKITEFEEAATELYTAIQAYATASGPSKICYNGSANPYFFKDTNGNGTCDAAESVSANQYNVFNPKLLKAAFNYQWTQKEPGAWAHNEFYVLQAVYDSIVDLGFAPSFVVTASTTDLTLNRP